MYGESKRARERERRGKGESEGKRKKRPASPSSFISSLCPSLEYDLREEVKDERSEGGRKEEL